MPSNFTENLHLVTFKNREEWLKARTDKIGGSDAASIVGLNPYKSNEQLWKEKAGLLVPEDISDKSYVKYGHDAEPLLRELFKLDFPELEVFYEEDNMFINDKFPFAHASLDGWLRDKNGRMGIWECKTTEIMSQAMASKWEGESIPDNYYIQVLHYLMVTEFEFVILKAQLKHSYGNLRLETKHYHIERSEVEEDIEYLRQEEEKFYKSLKESKKPNLILPDL